MLLLVLKMVVVSIASVHTVHVNVCVGFDIIIGVGFDVEPCRLENQIGFGLR